MNIEKINRIIAESIGLDYDYSIKVYYDAFDDPEIFNTDSKPCQYMTDLNQIMDVIEDKIKYIEMNKEKVKVEIYNGSFGWNVLFKVMDNDYVNTNHISHYGEKTLSQSLCKTYLRLIGSKEGLEEFD